MESLARPLEDVPEMNHVKLYATTLDVQLKKQMCLAEENGELIQYKADTGDGKLVKYNAAPTFLNLKRGCPVILIKTLRQC